MDWPARSQYNGLGGVLVSGYGTVLQCAGTIKSALVRSSTSSQETLTTHKHVSFTNDTVRI